MRRSVRFGFGRNWQAYAKTALTVQRSHTAIAAFERLFEGIELNGRSFLDIGFGQGLAAVIAASKGAKVLAIDIDPDNNDALRSTQKAMGFTGKIETQIISILDQDFVRKFKGGFNIVHSWGVLHHTGQMYIAIQNACDLVKEGGYLVISIYNRHWSSPFWKVIKYLYNLSPNPVRSILIWLFYPIIFLAKWAITGKDPRLKDRGMDFYHDLVDWIGGYPYEYATSQQIVDLMGSLGFELVRSRRPEVPTGCNEFVFHKKAMDAMPS